MIVGGTGLVGRAILKKVLPVSRRLIVLGLRKKEVEETLTLFSGKVKEETHPVLGSYLRSGKISGFWGDIFLSLKLNSELKGKVEERKKAGEKDIDLLKLMKELLERDERFRLEAIEDLLGLLRGRKRGRTNYLRVLLKNLKPDVVVDTVNTATAIAYRDIFKNVADIYKLLKEDAKSEAYKDYVTNLLLSLNIPILLNHAINLYEGLKEAGSRIYLKVGTTGTGGMGWNIPYTHGEDKPSKKLLDKSAIAGASTMLFVLMNRDDSPVVVKEIKPGAMIGWKKISKGTIIKRGAEIILKEPVAVSLAMGTIEKKTTPETGKVLKTAYIDTGENGFFSLEEFRAITSLSQMEMITPEDIAEVVFLELKGKSTGKDVVGVVESAILGPSYRGGFMRDGAIKLLEKYEKESPMPSVAFEILGPPRLSKLLFEAHILKETFKTLTALSEAKPEVISKTMWDYLKENPDMMSYITSIGIGVLSPSRRLYYTEELKVPNLPVNDFSAEDVEEWAHKGWVDTRVENARRWKYRAMMYLEELTRKYRELKKLNASSAHDRIGLQPLNLRPKYEIVPGEIVRWIFIHEDKGRRTRPY